MEISKKNSAYNTYNLEVSYGELIELKNRLEKNHVGAIADDMYHAMQWYIDRLPAPGQEKSEKDAELKSGVGGDSPSVNIDAELPSPETDSKPPSQIEPKGGDEDVEDGGDELEPPDEEAGEDEFHIQPSEEHRH